MTAATAIEHGTDRPVWTAHVDDAPVALTVRPGGPGGEPLVAVACAEGLLSVRGLDGRQIARSAVPGGLLTVSWAPDGRTLAVGGPQGAGWWTEAGGVRPLDTSGWCSSLAWNEAGRLAVADGRAAAVFEVSPDASARCAWRTPEVASTVTGLSWLRLGRELAVAAYGGLLAFAPGRTNPVRELRYAGSLLAVAVSPDGRWIVSGNQDASIHIWRRRDGAELEMAGLVRKVTLVEFDGSGRWLAANGSPDSTVWDFSGRGPGGTSPRLLAVHPDGATALAWHPQRPVLATGGDDGVLALWDVTRAMPAKPAEPRWSVAVDGKAGVRSIAWTPDGAAVVVASGDGTVASYAPSVGWPEPATGGTG